MKQIPNQGFTLVEVLVAVLVLSLGLLGLAGLQVSGLRNGHSAYQRSQATILAADLGDRMRANMAGVSAGNYNQPTAASKTGCTTTAGCAPTDMAQHDAFEWTQAIAAELPNGQGVVCVDSTPDDGTPAEPACDGFDPELYAIKIWWDDDRDGGWKRFVASIRPIR